MLFIDFLIRCIDITQGLPDDGLAFYNKTRRFLNARI